MIHCLVGEILTNSTEKFDTESGEYVEEKKEEKSKVADFWQCLNDGIKQSANRNSHLQ